MPTARKTLRLAIGYGLLVGVLSAVLRHAPAVGIITAGVVFFHVSWLLLRRRFAPYLRHLPDHNDCLSATAPAGSAGPPRPAVPAWAWITMVLASILIAAPMGVVALKASDNSRMIWAFHEDEGWLADLYDNYASSPRMDLGERWGYTYGSFNLMLVSFLARAVRPVMHLDGTDCVILNRMLLMLAFVATGWLVFCIAVRSFGSPGVGVVAAALLWSNSKAVEIGIPCNYPDVFGMLLITIAIFLIARMLSEFHLRTLFLAPLFVAVGFSIKYMGLPLVVFVLVAFFLSRKRVAGVSGPRRALGDLGLYSAYTLAAIPVGFFMVNPYYLVHWRRFASQMRIVWHLYGSGNINALPASGVTLPSLGDWWQVATGGGTPDGVLFVAAGICGVLTVFRVVRKRGRFDRGSAFVCVAMLFAGCWAAVVMAGSQFAFFHYFLPALPSAYLVAAASAIYARESFPARCARLRRFLPGLLLAALLVYVTSSVVVEIRNVLRAGQAYTTHSFGYAARSSLLKSRLGRTFQLLSTVREVEGSVALEVGRWLEDHCPEARTLVTNETIFYYPPRIEQIKYLNRQLDMLALVRTMPDLLIVSDYFVEMYTRRYEQNEIDAMDRSQRDQFLRARQFYSLVKDRDAFLNYVRIKTFDAPKSWYWKRLHIYERQGPRTLKGLLASLGGSRLMPPPNGSECLTFDGFVMPVRMYAAAVPGQAMPYTLDIRLARPIEVTGIGAMWWSTNDHPTQVRLELWLRDQQLLGTDLPINVGQSAPFSWVELDRPAERADRIVLKVSSFAGQQRLIMRRLLIRGGGPA